MATTLWVTDLGNVTPASVLCYPSYRVSYELRNRAMRGPILAIKEAVDLEQPHPFFATASSIQRKPHFGNLKTNKPDFRFAVRYFHLDFFRRQD